MAASTVAMDARLVGKTSTGDSTYWTGLLEGFCQISSDLRLLLYSDGPVPDGVVLPPNARWIELPARSSRFWSYVQFPLAARKAGARAIHTQYSLSPLVGRHGITTVHDVSFFIGPEWFQPKDRFILQRSVPAAVRRAARVLAVSETCKGEIASYIPAAQGKTDVTFNACPSWIQRLPRSEAVERVRSKFGIDEPYVLTVGTRWPRKNFGLAVAAMASLPQTLVITGKSGWGDQSPGPRGHAVGYVSTEDLSALYSAADLYLLPSFHEGFGIPILEAFRCGCPVLSSSGGAAPEVCGLAARVMPTFLADDWTAAIAELLGDRSKLEAMQESGFTRERDFSWKATAAHLDSIYREVCNR